MRLHKLTATGVAKARGDGLRGDGGFLYLQIRGASRSWIFRYRKRYFGLGSYPMISLRRAREIAAEMREALGRGEDPAAILRPRVETVRKIRFADAAEAFIEAHEPSWRNPKTARRWRSIARDHVVPHIGRRDVRDVTTEDILRVLQPIWTQKAETAGKARQQIENILDWARTKGLREGENPARWRGHLEYLLPARNKALTIRPHAAMPWREVPAFFSRLGNASSESCLAFVILTACRSGEARLATWDEVDLQGRTWRVPAGRTKQGREHLVPLSDAVLELLEGLPRRVGSEYVFSGQRTRRPLSDMALAMALRRLGRGELTVHGFRSSFRDWTSEATRHERELAEMSLGHSVGDAVERAYFRSDLRDRRRLLMQDWADFVCASECRSEQ